MKTVFLTNAGSLATNKRILAGRTEARLRGVARLEAEKMKFVAQSLSGGTLSLSQLRQMGHPYARRFPPGSAGPPDSVINRQTGLFASSWRTRVQRTSGGWTISLWNDAPEAKYLLGTTSMRARPILEAVLAKTAPALPIEARKAIRQAIRENGAVRPSLPAWGGILYAIGVGVASAAGGVAEAF